LQNLVKYKRYLGLAAILVVCLVAWAVLKPNAAKNVTEDVPLVRTSIVGLDANAGGNTYAGEVRGRYESQLAFQVGGKVIKRNVEVGSIVHAGDILMQIDAKDIQQNVVMGSAGVYAAESQLKLAESNLRRYKQLYEDGVVGRAAYEQVESQYDAAVAAVRQASARNAQGENQLDYSCLYADSDGVVAAIAVESGQIVGAGQPVVTLIKSGEQEVEINIPENKVEEVRKAPAIKVSFWALPGVSVDGKVREIAPVADKVSRTYKARISIVNPPAEMKLGMTAAVSVLGGAGQQAVLYIPLSAIYQTNDVPSVWVVNGDTVTLRQVTLGSYGKDKVEVVQGLAPGEQIVISGVHKLRQDQKIRVAGGDVQ